MHLIALSSIAGAAGALLLAALARPGRADSPRSIALRPVGATGSVANDPDDPAVWMPRGAPRRSLVLATNKVAAAEGGALYVFDLSGRTRQVVSGLDRPNNVAVAQDVRLGERRADLAFVTERRAGRVRVFGIARDGRLSERGRFRVFAGATGDASAPMGIATYRRRRDGAVFVIVGRKSGPRDGYLEQYRVAGGPAGQVRLALVRRFGAFSGKKEIEALAVDDARGLVYYADEGFGIRVWRADPRHPAAGREVGVLGRGLFRGDPEGVAIYAPPGGQGYVVCTDQIKGGSRFFVFPRVGSRRAPVAVLTSPADETDGIEILSRPLGPRFPHGMLIAMNSGPKNFLYFPWPAALR